MSEDLLPAVTVETAKDPTHAVIWLHGLGADGHDFEPLVPHLGFLDKPAVRFVFPHAPRLPVTINGGMVMPAWYDIVSLSLEGRADADGVRRSAARVAALVKDQNDKGIPTERIVIAGFSQGGAVAVHVGLRHPDRFAGILALSTYLAAEDDLDVERSQANAMTPVFCGHGTLDPVVPALLGDQLTARVTALGNPVTSRRYRMEHAVCDEEIHDVAGWLRERLATWTG